MRGVVVAGWLTLGGCGTDRDPCAIELRVDSIDAALAGLDELPGPVTMACFLTSLERPIGIGLTSDVFNTQPAQGARSPRIFVSNETLTMTIVPVGEASNLLEFGEAHPSGMTVKAEIAFPIALPFDPDDAFERTLARPGADVTGCQVCHFTEIEVAPGRFANTPLRPPDGLVVPLSVLLDEHDVCDWDDDAERCEMFSALLDHGEVVAAPFPASHSTQFGP